jgi:hypothetical protein
MLGKLTSAKAERVARTILIVLKEKKKKTAPKSAAQDPAATAEGRKTYYAGEGAPA